MYLSPYTMTHGSRSSLVLLLLAVLNCHCIDVFVDQSSTNNDCRSTTYTNPCNDLSASLTWITHASHSLLTIFSGVYTLPELTSYMFLDVRNITIKGINGLVEIVCTDTNSNSSSGIGFISSKNITIQDLSIIGCGSEQKSTARNFTEYELALLPVIATIYFDSCESVTLSSVTVNESIGMAVQMYSTYGTVEIIDCKFSANGPQLNRTNNDTIWGGGVYIEFPFCAPGNNSCSKQNTSSVDISTVSNSKYSIRSSSFVGNVAHDPDINHMILAYHTYHKATGRGGGLSVFFKGKATENMFTIDSCVFSDNSAVYGGGVYIEMQDSAQSNTVTIINSNFTNNRVAYEGAGLLVSYLSLTTLTGDEVKNSSVVLRSNRFERNSFHIDVTHETGGTGLGGGVSYTTTRQPNSDDGSNLNKFSMSDSTFIENYGFIGSGCKISAYSIEDNGYLNPVTIDSILLQSNKIFDEDRVTHSISSLVGSGAMYVSDVPVHFSGSVTFIENHETALSVFNSKIEALENSLLLFLENRGYDGGALALQSGSVLVLNKNVELNFTGNIAFNRGAAIFVSYANPTISVQAQSCFIQYHDINVNPHQWEVQVVFQDNLVRLRGGENRSNAIYSSSLYPCILGQPYGTVDSNFKSQLSEVFCWNENWSYNGNNTASCKEYINTDVSQFEHENISANDSRITIVPGQATALKMIAKDEQGNKINSTIILHPSSMTRGVVVDSAYFYTSDNHVKILNHENASTAVIQLDTVDQLRHVRAMIEVNIAECPPGFKLMGGVCICNETFGGVLRWKYDDHELKAELLSGYWIGKLSRCYENKNESTVVVTHCKYCNFDKVKGGYYELGQDFSSVHNDLCGSNRKGQICSECILDYKPAIDIDNFSCVECNQDEIVKGAFMFFGLDVLVPLLLIIVLGFVNVPLTNGLLHGPIFIAQMITSVVTLNADGVIQYKELGAFAKPFNYYFQEIYIFLYDLFNLEFFMFAQNKCIGLEHFSDVVALHFVTAFIPMGFVALCWLLFMCFDRQSRYDCESKIKTWLKDNISLPNLFATCILLSYTKILVIACYLLTPISLVSYDGHYGNYSHSVLYIDGSVCYSDKGAHFGFSLAVTFIFLIPIPLILMVFRYTSDNQPIGFIESIVKQFQQQFRQKEVEYEALHSSGCSSSCCTGIKSNPDSTHEIEFNCCGRSIQNTIEYKYDCCTPKYVCRYYQQRSRYCPICINVSFNFLDLRWVSGMSFIVRLIMILPYLLAWTTIIRYTIQFSICMFGGILVLIVKPYKRNLYKYVDCNRVEAFSFFNLAFILSLCIYQFHYSTTPGLHLSIWAYILQVILVSIPFIWIAVVYAILVKERHPRLFSYCCRKGSGSPSSAVQSQRSLRASKRQNSEIIPLVDTGSESYEPRSKPIAAATPTGLQRSSF